MKKIYMMFIAVVLGIFSLQTASAQLTYYSKAAATDFNDVNSWGLNADGTGAAPGSISTADSFVVQNNAALTLSATASVRHLLIAAGSLTVAANTLTVEVPGQNNSKIVVGATGQLNLTGGTIIVNGAVYFANGAGFTHSSGLLKIDPNSGTAATSIGGVGNTTAKTFGIGYGADGVATSTISSAANVAKFQLTGGTIQIVDPPLTTSTSAYSLAVHTGTALNFGTAHTVKFGDGISTQAAGSANGFYVYLFPGSSYGVLGNVEVDVLTGTNRFVKTTGNVGILGNLNIVSGEFWNTSNLYVNGNIVNNGIFTIASVLYFGTYFNATVAASTNTQSVTGAGVFRNLQTAPTANANSITIHNSNATGVSLPGTSNIATQPAGSFSVSGTLTFTAGKLSSTGSSIVLGISSGTPSVGTLSYTAGGLTSGTTFGRSWTAAATGSSITAGADPTTSTSRFPFITAAGAARSAWIQRVGPTAAGVTFVQYNESAGISAVSIADGAYTVNTRSNDNWVTSRLNADAASYVLAIVAPGVYSPIDNTTRIVRASDVVGNYQQGTITPGGQRAGLLTTDLANTFYLGVNIPTCLPPTALTTTGTTVNSGSFSWTAPASAPAGGYQFYVSTSNTAPIASTTPSGTTGAGVTNATQGGLAPNTLHYYWVRSDCSGGDLSPWAGPATFITGYCAPAATSSASYINNFSTTGGATNISNLNSGFTTGGYQDNYNTISGTVAAGGTMNFNLDFVGGTLGSTIWIDLNKNQLFENSERLFTTSAYTASGATNITGSITIPLSATAGDYRMRVIVDFNTASPSNACAYGNTTTPRGEAEDYKITLTPAPTDAMDWVNLQWPPTATTPAGSAGAAIYTKGYEPGVTEAAGPGNGITVWIGVSPVGAPASSDPSTWTNWIPATFNVQILNDDEFTANIGGNLAVGTYQYASRWQLNGGPYRYGGYNNATNGGFWDGITNVSGVLTVTAPLGDDPCDAIDLVVDAASPVCINSTPYTSVGDPNISSCSTPNNTVWFKFTPTVTGIHTIIASVPVGSTNGLSGWLFLYTATGTCPGTLTFTSTGGVNCTAGPASATAGTVTNINTPSLNAGTTYYLLLDGNLGDVGDACIRVIRPLCVNPTATAATSLTSNSAFANWTPTTGNFVIEYGPTATFTPTGTGATAGNANNSVVTASNVGTIQMTGLTASTGYSYVVRQDCTGAGNGYSINSNTITFTTTAAPPANDNAAGAITLTVGAGCAAAPYTNVNATQGATEKFASCYQSATTGTGVTIATHTVWFKFVATSSAVRVTTDITGGTLADTHLGLFSATNASDYNTFTILSCDDDNGNTGTTRSILYATGLTPAQEYYVSVDGYNGGTGTFCVAVDNLSSSMLSTTNTCASGVQTPSGSQTSYAGQVPLVDNSGNLIALTRNPLGGRVDAYNALQNINIGAVRQSPLTGTYYLDRNYRINNSSATNVEVQFFFLATEMAALNTADATTLATLSASRQTGTTCQNNFDGTTGTETILPQTGNGTSADGNVNWITVVTPSFSNFYLHKIGQALPITIDYFRGTKQADRNLLDWKVTCTGSPTVTMTLERSADARRYEAIYTTVETAARCQTPFNQLDLNPLPGINYYRLKTIDIDGKIAYSNVVALLNKDKGFEIVSLAPNPVHDEATLNITSAEKSTMELVITDIHGKQISKQRVNLIAGNNQVKLELKTIAAGTYQVSGFTPDGAKKTLRFVKQ
jgi:hypothetical protein